jgi:hypothetical protein
LAPNTGTAWHFLAFSTGLKKSQLDMPPVLRIFAKFGKSEVVLANQLGFFGWCLEE